VKITRSHLRKIIKEEIVLLSEGDASDMIPGWDEMDLEEKLDRLALMIAYNHDFVNTFEGEYSLSPWKKLEDLEDKVEHIKLVTSMRITHHSHEDDDLGHEEVINLSGKGDRGVD